MSTLATHISDLSTRVATECKALRTLTNGNAADLSALTTTSKTSLVSALNELKSGLDSAVAGSGATINDTSTASTTQTYSITKIRDLVTTSIAVLTAGAPTALDTLNELASALGNDASFSATITTSLGNRVRYDAAQTLTAPQKVQVKSNIDAYGALEIGDPDTNYVTTFNSGLI
jgi:hypothetical protein